MNPRCLLLGWFPPQTFSADAVNAVDNSHFDAETLDVWLKCEADGGYWWCDTHPLIWWHWRLFELLEYFCSNFSLLVTCNEHVSPLAPL